MEDLRLDIQDCFQKQIDQSKKTFTIEDLKSLKEEVMQIIQFHKKIEILKNMKFLLQKKIRQSSQDINQVKQYYDSLLKVNQKLLTYGVKQSDSSFPNLSQIEMNFNSLQNMTNSPISNFNISPKFQSLLNQIDSSQILKEQLIEGQDKNNTLKISDLKIQNQTQQQQSQNPQNDQFRQNKFYEEFQALLRQSNKLIQQAELHLQTENQFKQENQHRYQKSKLQIQLTPEKTKSPQISKDISLKNLPVYNNQEKLISQDQFENALDFSDMVQIQSHRANNQNISAELIKNYDGINQLSGKQANQQFIFQGKNQQQVNLISQQESMNLKDMDTLMLGGDISYQQRQSQDPFN